MYKFPEKIKVQIDAKGSDAVIYRAGLKAPDSFILSHSRSLWSCAPDVFTFLSFLCVIGRLLCCALSLLLCFLLCDFYVVSNSSQGTIGTFHVTPTLRWRFLESIEEDWLTSPTYDAPLAGIGFWRVLV